MDFQVFAGIVYLAVQESLGRQVALKVLPYHVTMDAGQTERFRREALAVARLEHRHIVPVYGIGEDDGVHFYAMQYIEGRTLHDLVRTLRRLRDADDEPLDADEPVSHDIAAGMLSGRFLSSCATGATTDASSSSGRDDRRAESSASGRAADDSPSSSSSRSLAPYFQSVARLGAQAADALDYANAQGVLHRDVKPSNILVDRQGEAWVTDFGLAKISDTEDLTGTGDIVGTLRYMAPERFRGWSDPRSDVYGLGITLYELTTLRAAFTEQDRAQLIERVTKHEPPPPRKLDPRIPRDLETILLKAIAKEPGQRYPSAGELAADLGRFLEGRPIAARRTSLAERARLWCKRNPVVATLAVSLATLLVVMAVGSSVAAVQLRQQRDAEFAARQLATRAQDKAETEAQRAQVQADRARKEAAKAAQINQLLEDMLISADPNEALGAAITVRQILDAAAERIAEGLPGQPEVEAALRDTIGWTYTHLGKFDEAEGQLRAALALRRGTLGDEHPDTATTLDHLCRLLSAAYEIDSDQYREAIELCRQAVAIRRAALGTNHALTVESHGYLSFLEHRSGDTAQAQRTMSNL